MKIKLITTTLFLLFFSSFKTALCPPDTKIFILRHEGYKPFEKIWEAVCFVESTNNPLAYNAAEGATGIVQIRQIKLDEYNQKTGNNYKIEDCFCHEFSKQVFMWHMMSYGVGRWEEGVKRWNGKGRMTEVYLEKVKKVMQ